MSIQIKRGMKKDLPQLKDGELAFCKDTKELYVGSNGNENVNVTDKSSEIINGFDNKIKEIESTLSSNIEQTKTNKEYIESKKSAIQKVIDFVDAFRCEFKFVSNTNGYIKFPNILSGALIQWGYVTIPVGNETTVCTLNKPFSDFNYCFHLTPYMTNGVYSTVHTNGVTENSINVVLKGVNGSNPGGGLYWLAIGR